MQPGEQATGTLLGGREQAGSIPAGRSSPEAASSASRSSTTAGAGATGMWAGGGPARFLSTRSARSASCSHPAGARHPDRGAVVHDEQRAPQGADDSDDAAQDAIEDELTGRGGSRQVAHQQCRRRDEDDGRGVVADDGVLRQELRDDDQHRQDHGFDARGQGREGEQQSGAEPRARWAARCDVIRRLTGCSTAAAEIAAQ